MAFMQKADLEWLSKVDVTFLKDLPIRSTRTSPIALRLLAKQQRSEELSRGLRPRDLPDDERKSTRTRFKDQIAW